MRAAEGVVCLRGPSPGAVPISCACWVTPALVCPRCRFCAESLAALPWVGLDEPLACVHAVNRAIQLRGGAVLGALKTALLGKPPKPHPCSTAQECGARLLTCLPPKAEWSMLQDHQRFFLSGRVALLFKQMR